MRKRIAATGIILALIVAWWWYHAPLWPEIPKTTSEAVVPIPAEASREVRTAPPAPAARPAPAPPAGLSLVETPGRISGRVFQPDGRPAAGAAIRATWKPSEWTAAARLSAVDIGAGAPLAAVSDGEGRFIMEELHPGWFVVSAEHETGCAVVRMHLADRRLAQQVSLVLVAGEALGGRVVRRDGGGIAGARVIPLSCDGRRQFKHASDAGAVQTDEGGYFRFASLSPGAWILHASADGFGAAASPPIPSGVDNARIVLGPEARLACHVRLLANGAPVAGVTVALTPTEFAVYPLRAVSDAGGLSQFSGLGKGEYTVGVVHATYTLAVDAPRISIDPERKTPVLTLEVTEGGQVEGQVRDGTTGNGIAGVVIVARLEHGASFHAPPTGEDGYYTLRGLPAGDFTIEPQNRVPGYPQEPRESPAKQIAVSPGGRIAAVDFVLARGPLLAGRVVDAAGAPVEGATVLARNVDGRQNLAEYVTLSDGRFEFGAYESGEPVGLCADKSPFRSGYAGPYVVGNPGSDAITLALGLQCDGVIAGRVVDRQGNPVSCEVAALSSDPAMKFPVLPPSGRTDGYGSFVLTDVCSGVYTLAILPGRDHRQEAQTVNLSAGEVLAGLHLVYDPGEVHDIAGEVVDEDGNPIAGARVTARITAAESLLVPPAPTDADGVFRFTGLPAGTYMLEVAAAGYQGGGFVAVEAGTEGVQLMLAAALHVAGQVVDGNGMPMSDFVMTLLPGDNPEARAISQRIADPAGAFNVALPRPGNWILRIETAGRPPVEIALDAHVQHEELSNVVVVLEPASGT